MGINNVGKKIGKNKVDEYVKFIAKNIENINDNMFDIGEILYKIKDGKWYIFNGYKNLLDFCKDELNIGKNQVYNLIGIYLKFNNEEYKQYNYSQLSEMLSLTDEQLISVDESYSVKQIRDLKKENKKNISLKMDDPKVKSDTIQIQEEMQQIKKTNIALQNELEQLKKTYVEINNENEKKFLEYEKLISKYLDKDLKGNYMPKWIIPEQEPLIKAETEFSYEEIKGILFYLKKACNMKPLLFKRTLDKTIYFFEHIKAMNGEKENEIKKRYNKELELTLKNINDFCVKKSKRYSETKELSYIHMMIYDNTYDLKEIYEMFGDNLMYTIKREYNFDKIIIDKY